MNNTDDPARDKEQLAPVPMDYLTLLSITRPLVIIQSTCGSLEFPIHEDRAISLQVKDWWVEFALKQGEIIFGDVPIGGRQGEEGSATTPALPQRGSHLRIRIHLGMS